MTSYNWRENVGSNKGTCGSYDSNACRGGDCGSDSGVLGVDVRGKDNETT